MPAAPTIAESLVPLRSDARRNRDAVVGAALRVLAEDPDATMREVADASGVGRTTLYRHFASREELIDALSRRVHAEAVELVRAAARAPGPALDVLAALCHEIVDLGDRYRFLIASPPKPADAPRPTAGLVGYVRAAQRRGELRDDLPARWIVDTISALALAACGSIAAGELTPARAANLLSETFIGAVAPR